MGINARAFLTPDLQARADQAQRLPNLPIEHYFGIRQIGYGVGRTDAVQRMPQGSGIALHAGWLGVLADYVTGRAVQTIMSPTTSFRTASIHIALGSRGLRATGSLMASSKVVDVGGDSVLATATVKDTAGEFVADVSTRFIVVSGESGPGGWNVTTRGPSTPDELFDDFLGATVTRHEPGSALVTCPAADWMTNPYSIVHGGVSIALAGLALSEAAGPSQTLGLDLTFHRPALIGDIPIKAEASVNRAGKRVVAANAVVYQRDIDRPVLTATTTMIRLGRA